MQENATVQTEQQAHQDVDQFIRTFKCLTDEISKFIVGQQEIIEKVLISIICGGHVLLEGVPGLGKTALVQTVSQAMHLDFSRIQFTPDLLPADIMGTNILVERQGEKVFQFQPGPVFANIVLADEINRATPKTQSAMLETMQEKTVTVARTTHRLSLPFFVMATQNPIEMDGTYPLPEAQLDRFFFKLTIEMPSHNEFSTILDRTGGIKPPQIKPVTGGPAILEMEKLVRQVPIEQSVTDHLIRIVKATHPKDGNATGEVKRFVRYGASPRAAQAILASSRAKALLEGRFHVSREDVDIMVPAALRHRMILSFEGEAEGITTDEVIQDIIRKLN